MYYFMYNCFVTHVSKHIIKVTRGNEYENAFKTSEAVLPENVTRIIH